MGTVPLRIRPDLVLFDTFKKCVLFEQVKLKVQFIYLTACMCQNCIHEVKFKIEDAVHRQFSDIKLNRIDDMVIVIEPNDQCRFTPLPSEPDLKVPLNQKSSYVLSVCAICAEQTANLVVLWKQPIRKCYFKPRAYMKSIKLTILTAKRT